MVRLYFEKPNDEFGADKSKYVDIYYWSIMKAYLLIQFGLLAIFGLIYLAFILII